MAAETKGLELRLRVPLPSAGVGQVALGALGPDLAPPHPPPPPPSSSSSRPGGGTPRPRPHPPPQLQLDGGELVARWEAAGARGLRGGVTSFLELLGLVLETIERFGPAPPRDPPRDPPQDPPQDPQ